MITIDDFKKVELRVGRILAVENHPKADRLYVLRVDVGPAPAAPAATPAAAPPAGAPASASAPAAAPASAAPAPPAPAAPPAPVIRQIVAGIKLHFKPEDLVGKFCVIVNNLQPAMLRGVESQGMLLVASEGGGVVLLSPEKPVTPGSPIS
ncbi:MAG: hypothetical protein HYZ53_28575 [Planctomycetes bacterium]|nr:hypothetical protein [Planctomycetota bacterium]